jgi:peptidoglycan L-alanyl-D-glutamate endopeptidase CwlK
MGSFSKRSKSRLIGVLPIMVQVFEVAIKNSPYDFGIPEGGGRRSDQDQLDMFAIGRTTQINRKPVTWTLNSKHKAKEDGFGYAIDIYAYVNGKASWDRKKYLEPIARHVQKVAREEFCVEIDWGFDLWKKDGAHFQFKKYIN